MFTCKSKNQIFRNQNSEIRFQKSENQNTVQCFNLKVSINEFYEHESLYKDEHVWKKSVKQYIEKSDAMKK